MSSSETDTEANSDSYVNISESEDQSSEPLRESSGEGKGSEQPREAMSVELDEHPAGEEGCEQPREALSVEGDEHPAGEEGGEQPREAMSVEGDEHPAGEEGGEHPREATSEGGKLPAGEGQGGKHPKEAISEEGDEPPAGDGQDGERSNESEQPRKAACEGQGDEQVTSKKGGELPRKGISRQGGEQLTGEQGKDQSRGDAGDRSREQAIGQEKGSEQTLGEKGGEQHREVVGDKTSRNETQIPPRGNLDSKRGTPFSDGRDQKNRSGGGWSLAPAHKLWTVLRDGAVQLRTKQVSEQRPPLTVPQFFTWSVRQWDQQTALCVKRADNWTKITYAEYERQTRSVARALLKLGLQRFHGVLILGGTSPEWFMAEIGSIMAGGLAVGIDPSCPASSCQEVAMQSEAQVVIVQDHRQLEKILQVQDQLPQVRAIVQCEGKLEVTGVSVFTWDDFIVLGLDEDDVYLNEVIESQKANQCCAVMYAAGVTTVVRGVMLSHDNVTWMARSICDRLNLGPNEVVVSYQPLNDMTVQLTNLWLPLCCGGTTYFAESSTPESSLISVLCHVRPTIFLGCSSFWEKIMGQWESLEMEMLQKMLPNEWNNTPLLGRARAKLFTGAQAIGQSTYHAKMDSLGRFFQLPLKCLAELLVFRPARAALGLNHCTYCYTGTSTISPGTVEFLWKLGLQIRRLYGLNETCGGHSIGHPDDAQTQSCDQNVPGCLSRRHVSCMWGRHIFMGYLGLEEETQSVLDEDGWLCTGVDTMDSAGSF